MFKSTLLPLESLKILDSENPFVRKFVKWGTLMKKMYYDFVILDENTLKEFRNQCTEYRLIYSDIEIQDAAIIRVNKTRIMMLSSKSDKECDWVYKNPKDGSGFSKQTIRNVHVKQNEVAATLMCDLFEVKKVKK